MEVPVGHREYKTRGVVSLLLFLNKPSRIFNATSIASNRANNIRKTTQAASNRAKSREIGANVLDNAFTATIAGLPFTSSGIL